MLDSAVFWNTPMIKDLVCLSVLYLIHFHPFQILVPIISFSDVNLGVRYKYARLNKHETFSLFSMKQASSDFITVNPSLQSLTKSQILKERF